MAWWESSYDQYDRAHDPRCPAEETPDARCECAELADGDYDDEMDRRVDAARDRLLDD